MSFLSEAEFARVVAAIRPVDDSFRTAGQARLDSLTKPKDSLGRLEELALQLYCLQKGNAPLKATPARMYTIAGDHGVVADGVTAFPQEVTEQMVMNFLNGGAGINVLCKTAGIDLCVVDAGIIPDLPDHPLLIKAKIARGTASLARGPAMSKEECLTALSLGLDLARQAREGGMAALGMGEMGIGNTTSSTALLCAFYGFSPEEMTGIGAGAPPAGLAHKIEVIAKALELHKDAVSSKDPLTILACLGGLEIATLTGLVLGAAREGLAVMVDGFIATAAYACALHMAPQVEGYCFFGHTSAESGHARALETMGKKALVDMGFRLGEGTGAALGLFLLRAAADIFNDMATFASSGVNAER